MKLIKYKGKIYRTKRAPIGLCCNQCAFNRGCIAKITSLCVKGLSNYYFKEVKNGVQKVREDC